MNEHKTVKIHCLSTALSPITHMMGVSGNEGIINRTKVISGGQIFDVPVLSGNAIRHKMIREPGAMLIVKTCKLDGNLTIDQANYLFYGGSLTDSQTGDNLKKIAEMQELLPLIRLLGGSLRNQVVSGSLLVSMGTLICEENRETLHMMLPGELLHGLPELRSCEDFVDKYQYTRGDIGKKPGMMDASEEPAEKSNLMIYSGQSVVRGAMFYHSFILQNVSRLEVGALIAAMNDWHNDGGIVGGSSRIGHGRLHTAIHTDTANFFGDTIDLSDYEAEYRQHIAGNTARITAWLNEVFPARTPKSVKEPGVTKKSKAPKSTPSQLDFFEAVQGELI